MARLLTHNFFLSMNALSEMGSRFPITNLSARHSLIKFTSGGNCLQPSSSFEVIYQECA